MWINRLELEKLRDDARMKIQLEQEVQRLAELISAEVKDCKIGPWCSGCRHHGTDRSVLSMAGVMGHPFVCASAGEVSYCKKHIHEICPEFER